jgi:CMP-N,N'-diacetyllegionaminic acid synthase
LRTLGIVPARGGSKGVPGKNIRPLAGKPLILHTLEAARQSECLERVVVTTDSPEIQDTVLQGGFEAPFLRPPELAADATPLIAAVKHCLEWCEKDSREAYDVVYLLQPTSPFRTSAHIRKAYALYIEQSPDTLVSVTRVPHRFVPTSLMCERDGYLHHYLTEAVSATRHGDVPLWARNGPAILITAAQWIRQGSFYGDKILPFPMDFLSSVDIDEEEDWTLAEKLVGANCRKGAPYV